MGEVLFIIGLIGFLVCPFILMRGKGRVFWLITMGTIGAWIGAMEIYARVIDPAHLTISRHFWYWSLEHEGMAWLLLGLLLIGWLILLVHLAWKMIKRRMEK